MSGGLKSGWESDFESWDRRFAKLREQVTLIHLRVLLWGAGEGTPDHPKRKEIADHLRAQFPGDDVATSEELVARNEDLFGGIHVYKQEELQWHLADVVIALVPKEPRVSGVRAELAMFGMNPNFIEKALVILPKLKAADRKKLRFLDLGWAEIPWPRKFSYTDRQYRDCSQIRKWSEDMVDQMRRLRIIGPLIGL